MQECIPSKKISISSMKRGKSEATKLVDGLISANAHGQVSLEIFGHDFFLDDLRAVVAECEAYSFRNAKAEPEPEPEPEKEYYHIVYWGAARGGTILKFVAMDVHPYKFFADQTVIKEWHEITKKDYEIYLARRDKYGNSKNDGY